MKRISKGIKCNKEALYLATVFHDIVYGNPYNQDKRGYYGQFDFFNYAKENNLSEELSKFVAYLIANHSYKELRYKEDCQIELALLQEAELLDETGLMTIEADCLRLGYDKTDNYLDSYYKHINHAYKELCEIEMVTPIAKKHWDKKKKDVEKYIKELSFDLGIKWEKEI